MQLGMPSLSRLSAPGPGLQGSRSFRSMVGARPAPPAAQGSIRHSWRAVVCSRVEAIARKTAADAQPLLMVKSRPCVQPSPL